MKRKLLLVFLLSFFWLPLAHAAGEVLDAGLHEEIVKISSTEKWLTGERQIHLVATIFRPDGAGPFPLLVLSHGSPRGGETERKNMKRSRLVDQSREFVKMGFAVVVPMRRGYGDSEGAWAEDYGGCSQPVYYKSGMETAKDLTATVQFMKKLPYVDGKRIVLAGQSAGGFASLATASLPMDGLVGVLNFSGGRGSTKPDVVCSPGLLVQAMEKFGSTSRVPTLWHYAENDHFFSPELVRKMFAAYTGAGGKARLVMQPPFGEDGHQMFGKRDGMKYWLPEARKFLKELGFKVE